MSNASLASRPPLLKTKISIPVLPAGFVHRRRLTERVSQGAKGPLTVVSAPAGFGKTNLLMEWAAETKLPVAWLTIDEEDNDPGRFFPYLISALQELAPKLGTEALDFFRSGRDAGLNAGLTLLINELSVLPKDLILVLDEFQALQAPSVLHGVDFLLKHLPRPLHLVLATRTEPALDLASLRVKGRLFELGADDLRFAPEEVVLFFRATTGVELPSDAVLALERNTDGWITGLQLAAITMRAGTIPGLLATDLKGDSYHLANFLTAEVLDRQPEEVHEFLLKSSILDRLCGPLCEAVVSPDAQPGYGSVMLDRLENANLFIAALDDQHQWFRYHHLFSDFLRYMLERAYPLEIPSLRKRAAAWFEQQGDLEEALKYAVASGDPDWAADLLERHVDNLFRSGEVFALTPWVGRLPEQCLRSRPKIAVAYAWGLLGARQFEMAANWLDVAEQGLESTGKRKGKRKAAAPQKDASSRSVYGALAVGRSILAMFQGDMEKAAAFSKQATGFLQEEYPFISCMLLLEDTLYSTLAGDTAKTIEALQTVISAARRVNNMIVLIIASCNLAEMQALQGQLSHALITLQKAQLLTTNADGSRHPLSGLVDTGFGVILLQRGVLDPAAEYLERGVRIAESLWTLGNLAGVLALAQLRQIEGDRQASQEIIERAASLAGNAQSDRWDEAMVGALAVRLALQRSDLPEAAQWWKRSGFPELQKKFSADTYPYHILEYLQLTQVRFMIASSQSSGNRQDLPLALDVLASLLRMTRRFKRVTSQMEVLVLQSIIQYAMEDPDAAAGRLLEALALGEPEDFRRVFLDEGQTIAPILTLCQEVQQRSTGILPSLGYIESLLEALQVTEAAGSHRAASVRRQDTVITARMEDGLPFSLSAREMQVLSLIAEGKSNQEIAAELYLALNTVKRHAYNIYSKLEVKKRTHAVLRARQLGLIP